jgi:quercetin dioxygenase-like cupin family protein
MKVIRYREVPATHFENDAAKAVDGRVIIGKRDNAENFFLRVFEIGPGGHTPKHSHDWEHEIFFHRGYGAVYGEGEWHPVESGSVAHIPPNIEHQIRNSGDETLVFACMIPSKAPEL